MMTRKDSYQEDMFPITLEELVEENHFLRRLASAVDFSFVYDELEPHYCPNNGRPSTDPVIIVKMLLIAFLYGIASERRLEQEVKYNVAYRWFLGIPFGENVPDHSTVSQLRRRKFNKADLFKKLFCQILADCINAGLVSGKLLITDSTHVKASASEKSKIRAEIEQESDKFFERLDEYESKERERLGLPETKRKPRKAEKIEVTKSATDSDAGWLNRTRKPGGFHFLSHQTLDSENGIIVDVEVTSGNAQDCTPYIDQIDRTVETLEEYNIEVEAVAADSAYDTGLIHQELENRRITPYMPQKNYGEHSKTEYKKGDFIYDIQADEFACPYGKALKLHGIIRDKYGVYRKYQANKKDCAQCPNREKCLSKSQKVRQIQLSIFQETVNKHHETDGSNDQKDALNKRQVWCEGTFAVQKNQHNLRQVLRRGLKAATDHCLLSACVVNLKRLIKHQNTA